MPAGFTGIIKDLLSSARYRVEGDSMSPALSHGDQVLASRVRTPYRRGDVVVFQQPRQRPDQSIPVFIKRIIGMPQEEIFLGEGAVRINGEVLPETHLTEASRKLKVDDVEGQATETARLWITGPGEYFVMGDQRGNSQDSRSFGLVDESLMLGRVWLRYWPLGAWGKIQVNPGGG